MTKEKIQRIRDIIFHPASIAWNFFLLNNKIYERYIYCFSNTRSKHKQLFHLFYSHLLSAIPQNTRFLLFSEGSLIHQSSTHFSISSLPKTKTSFNHSYNSELSQFPQREFSNSSAHFFVSSISELSFASFTGSTCEWECVGIVCEFPVLGRINKNSVGDEGTESIPFFSS